MVAVLVREDVRLGQRPAARAELRLELVEEAEVDVDVAVTAGSRRGRSRTTPAPQPVWIAVVEEARSRRLVAAQRAAPVGLDAVDDGDDPAVLALVRVRPGLALLRELAGGLTRWADRLAGERAEIAETATAAQEEEREQDDDRDEAAAAPERDGHPARKPARPRPAVVLDLRGVELRVLAKSHALNVPPQRCGRNPPATGSGRSADDQPAGSSAALDDRGGLLVLEVAPADEEDRDENAGERDRRGRPERALEAVGQRHGRSGPGRERVDRWSRPRWSRGSRCRPRRRSAATC